MMEGISGETKQKCEGDRLELDDSGFTESSETLVRIGCKKMIHFILLQKYSKCYSLYSGQSIAYPVTCEDIPGHQQRQSTTPSWRSNRGSAWHHPVSQPEVENLPETCRVQGGAGNNRSCRVQMWGPRGHHRGWIHTDNAQVATFLSSK